MPDADGCIRVPRGSGAEAWRPQYGQARGRIPADELRIDRLIVVPPDAQRLTRPIDRTMVRTASSPSPTPLAVRRRPWTCTTDGAAPSTSVES